MMSELVTFKIRRFCNDLKTYVFITKTPAALEIASTPAASRLNVNVAKSEINLTPTPPKKTKNKLTQFQPRVILGVVTG